MALTGTFPFEPPKGPFNKKVLEPSELFPNDVDTWIYASPESRDWIQKSMAYDPQYRLSVKTAMCHPWLQNSQLKKDLEALESQYGK